MSAGAGNGTKYERTIDNADLDAAAARLRARGKSYRDIALEQTCGVATAYERVQRAIAAVPVEAVNQLRATECGRLDAVIARAWEIVDKHHPVVSNGRVFEDVVDETPVIQALNLILRAGESKRRLLGLDAPQRRIISVITEDVVDDEMLQLDREYEALLAEENAHPAPDVD